MSKQVTSRKRYDWKGYSDKERLFCYAYLECGQKTQAAIDAGFKENSAQQQATRVYKKCKARIDEMLEDMTLKHVVNKDRIIQELALIAFADLKEAFNEDGSLKNYADMPEDVRRTLSAIDVNELFEGRGEDREQTGFIKKLRTHDKIKALELLGRNLQMFTQKLEIDNKRPMVVVKDMTGRKK